MVLLSIGPCSLTIHTYSLPVKVTIIKQLLTWDQNYNKAISIVVLFLSCWRAQLSNWLTSALLRLDQSCCFLDANNQTPSYFRIQCSTVSSFLNSENAFDPSNNLNQIKHNHSSRQTNEHTKMGITQHTSITRQFLVGFANGLSLLIVTELATNNYLVRWRIGWFIQIDKSQAKRKQAKS